MRKLLALLFVAGSIAFASCEQSAETAGTEEVADSVATPETPSEPVEEVVDTVAVEADSMAVDTMTVDTTAAE